MDLFELASCIDIPVSLDEGAVVTALKGLILKTIKENLEVKVSVHTESNYFGEMSNGSLYKDSHNITIELLLDGEVISSQTEYLS